MIVETIKCDKCKKDLSDPWMTFHWRMGNESHICKECVKSFKEWLHEPVEEEYPLTFKREYPLTFKEAVVAMLDGKVVVCEEMPDLHQRFQHGQFMVKKIGDEWNPLNGFFRIEREGKWKVVE